MHECHKPYVVVKESNQVRKLAEPSNRLGKAVAFQRGEEFLCLIEALLVDDRIMSGLEDFAVEGKPAEIRGVPEDVNNLLGRPPCSPPSEEGGRP